jgi:DNA-binding MarR family transcriptional regulator
MGAQVNVDERDRSARRVMDALRRIVRALRLFDRSAEQRVGLSGARVFVLQILADGGRMSMTELARRTQTDPSSVSVVAGKLAGRKLVVMKPSAADGRSREISITGAGRAMLRRVPEAAQSRLIAGLLGMRAREREHLARQMETLAERMGADDATMFFEDDNKARRTKKGS